jgi:hypothetical protein
VTREGYLARWQGAEYEASPDLTAGGASVRLYRTDPADGFDEVGPDRYRRLVPLAEVERLMYSTAVCTWRGEPFRVLTADGDRLRLEYVGGQAPVAERLGLERIDRGLYLGWVPFDEVRGMRGELILLH